MFVSHILISGSNQTISTRIRSAVQDALQWKQVLGRHVERFRGGLVFKAHEMVFHSTLGSTVIKKKEKKWTQLGAHPGLDHLPAQLGEGLEGRLKV